MRKFTEPLIHTLIWLVGYLFFIFTVKTLGIFNAEDQTLLLPVTVGTILNIILFYTTALIIIPTYSANKKAWLLLIRLAGVLCGITVLETTIDFFYFFNIYSSSASDQELLGQLTVIFILNLFVFSLALAYGFTKMWFRNEKQRQQLQQEKLTAELEFLKAQVNPHFLFNVLNMAYASAAGSGDERTADIIEKLANQMRYMLYESNVDTIVLEKEISYLESFVLLQKKRLSEEVHPHIRFEVSGDYYGFHIAPLLLIPFVENAFKHGIRMGKDSHVLIMLSVDNGQLFFRVENTIANIKNELNCQVGGIGLENVRKRLEFLYPDTHHLEIVKDGETHIVTLTLKVA